MMREEIKGDGVTTYHYKPDDKTAEIVLEMRHTVERIEALCRDILTALSLLIDLLPEAHGEPDKDTGL